MGKMDDDACMCLPFTYLLGLEDHFAGPVHGRVFDLRFLLGVRVQLVLVVAVVRVARNDGLQLGHLAAGLDSLPLRLPRDTRDLVVAVNLELCHADGAVVIDVELFDDLVNLLFRHVNHPLAHPLQPLLELFPKHVLLGVREVVEDLGNLHAALLRLRHDGLQPLLRRALQLGIPHNVIHAFLQHLPQRIIGRGR